MKSENINSGIIEFFDAIYIATFLKEQNALSKRMQLIFGCDF